MSLWLAIPIGVGIIAVVIALIKRRASSMTTLHIEN